MAKMRVVLFMPELLLTGAPKVALDIFDAIRDEVDPWILSPYGGPHEDRCRQLGQYTRIAPPHLSRRPQPGPLTSLRLQRWRPDMIYINSVAALRFVLAARLPAAPMLLHVHELECVFASCVSGIEDSVRRLPQRYIAVSEGVRRLLVDGYGIAPERISLIYECVPDEMASVRAATPKRLPGRPLVVGGAGRPAWRKGLELWLLMAQELVRLLGAGRVRFTWVGMRDDYDSRMFRLCARRLGIEEHIEFVPVTPDPLSHYANFDVFAMTSWEDPCPIVVLENMVLGNPVACFAGGGGAAEEVGETGIVAPEFSPVAMATAIAGLAGRPELLVQKGEAARERVRQSFVTSALAPRILDEIRATAAMGAASRERGVAR